jgi:tRNA pseudouridine55 synthase
VSAPRRIRRALDGVLLLDKPVGATSNAVLQRTRWLFAAEKAGHTGTLDPFASGLLPLCFGDATKFAQALLDATKSYVATVHLGVGTTTGDIDGEVIASAPLAVDAASIRAALPAFTGDVEQVPPRHSALKLNGRAYYDYARAGIDIPRHARPVTIHALSLTSWNPPFATLAVTCSKGTYIRVLAEDLGAALGCPAHLAALRRTVTGGFRLEDAVTLEQLEALGAPERDARLLPVEALLLALPALALPAGEAARLQQGQALATAAPDGRYRCRDEAGRLLGVALAKAGELRVERLCRTLPVLQSP